MQWRQAITFGAVLVAATTVKLEAQAAASETSDTASGTFADWAATRDQMVQTVQRDLQKIKPPATIARHTAPQHATPPKARELKIHIMLTPRKAKA